MWMLYASEILKMGFTLRSSYETRSFIEGSKKLHGRKDNIRKKEKHSPKQNYRAVIHQLLKTTETLEIELFFRKGS